MEKNFNDVNGPLYKWIVEMTDEELISEINSRATFALPWHQNSAVIFAFEELSRRRTDRSQERMESVAIRSFKVNVTTVILAAIAAIVGIISLLCR